MTGTDSAGVPWGGRTLPTPGFSGDDGAADAALEAALRDYAGAGTDVDAQLLRHARVLAALADARLLVPVVAVLDEVTTGIDGLHADKSTDMALVTLAARDGTPAVPAFTSLDRLTAWRADARPVPAESRRVALSAVAEGATRLVIDPAGPVTYVVERTPLWGLAQGRAWTPPAGDPQVLAVLRQVLAELAEVVAGHLTPRPPAGLVLVVELVEGLSPAEVDAVVSAIGARLGAAQVVAERVDGLALRLVAAGAAPPVGSVPLLGPQAGADSGSASI